MDRIYRNAVPLIIVTGVIVVATTLWRMWPQSSSSPGEYKFMHCAVCGYETPYSSKTLPQPCPHCKPPTIGHFIATAESVADERSPFRQMFAVLLIESVCIMGALVFFLYHPPVPSDERYYYTHCPNLKCRRKMRYRASRAGLAAQCPLCRTTLVNPTLEEQEYWQGMALVARKDADE